jgi:hypothetical protein
VFEHNTRIHGEEIEGKRRSAAAYPRHGALPGTPTNSAAWDGTAKRRKTVRTRVRARQRERAADRERKSEQ